MQPPTGTVSLVFTDIQGSTRLWERLADFGPDLQVHDAVLRSCLEQTGGYEVKTEGDAFMVAFSSSREALAFCLAAQEALHDADWSPELMAQPECGDGETEPFRGVRVRMGIHTGAPRCRPDPQTGRMDYFGPMVNRAARVEAAAHGGQILLSEAAWATAERDDLATRNLGVHTLKGLTRPETLREVLPLRLRERTFPPPRTTAPRRTNVTRRPTSFVGRQADLARLEETFVAGRQLVSIVGPGGTGKTSLALAFGEARLGSLPGGLWFCDCSDATSQEEVASSLGRALGVPLREEDPVHQVGEIIGARGRAVILLDNLEGVALQAGAVVSRWMKQAPEAWFLVTSRVPLHIPGEQLLPLAPLPLPRSDELEAAQESPAVLLFVERAREVQPRFALTAGNVGDITQILRKLDGLPLAIELAAARVRMMSPRAILARLSKRFEFLRSRGKGLPDRQATLRGAIDVSWELLNADERTALAQCSVFAGPFSLEAAEEVIELSSGDLDALDTIEGLVDHSLLRRIDEDDEVRFGLLSSIQVYASEKLPPGSRRSVEERHGAWFGERGTDPFLQALDGPEEPELRALLRRERVDLQAAAQRALARADWPVATRNIAAFAALVDTEGPFSSGLALLDEALAHSEVPTSLQAQLMQLRGRLTLRTGRVAQAIEELDRAMAIASEPGLRAQALRYRATAQRGLRRLAEARSDLEAARSIHQELGLPAAAAIDLANLSNVATDQGFEDEADQLGERAIEELRRSGARRPLGAALGNRGVRLLRAQRNADALASLEEGLQLLDGVGEQRIAVGHRISLATLHRREQRYSEAERLLNEALGTVRRLGDRAVEVRVLSARALVWRDQGRADEALQGLTEALKAAESVGNARSATLARGNLGETLLLMGRSEDAARELALAVEACESHNLAAARRAFGASLSRARQRGVREEPAR